MLHLEPSRLTQKKVRENHDLVIPVGYCKLQSLLKSVDAVCVGYTTRAEGWAADVYSFYHKGQSIAIVTGYAPFGKDRMNPKTISKFDDVAREYIAQDYTYYGSSHARAVFDGFLDAVLRENGRA